MNSNLVISSTLTHSASPRFTLDPCGYITDYNTDFFHLFGKPLDEQLFFSCLDQHDEPRFLRLMEQASAGLPVQESFRFFADGVRRSALLTLAPFYKDGQPAGFHGMLWEAPSQRRQYLLQNKVKAIFENDLECVKIMNVEGRLLDINPTGLAMLEVTDKAPLLGMKCLDAIMPQDQPAYGSLLENARRGESSRAQFRMFSMKGNQRWVDAKAVPLLEADRKVYAILMMGRDITEQKQAEAGLLLSQEVAISNAQKMMLIAECTNDSMFIISKEGKLEFFNQKAKEAVGVLGDDFLGLGLEELMRRAEAEQFLERYQQALRDQVPMHFEDYYHSRNMWVEVRVHPANGGIVVYFRNINERKEAEIKLAFSEQRFKAMVQNGSDIIAVLDAQMCLQYLSPTTTRIAGYEPRELKGKSIVEFIHPDDLHQVVHDFSEVVSFGNPGTETTHRFKHREGHYIWLESKAINLLDEDHIRGVIINARDISHHKALQAQLDAEVQSRQKEVTAAVIRAQERERSQLGQELHDNVNQVLTTIKLYNEMVMEGLGTANDLLPRSVFHLQSCINEIRSISKRLSAPTLGKISLCDSIRELVDSVNLTNRLSIDYQINGLESCCISQDLHLAIYRIIQEMLNNTLKYAQASNFNITITNNKTGLKVVLTDDGKGFDMRQKSQGIGITNMKTRAENLNGSFLVASSPGNGCRVEVVFPAISPES